MKRHIIAAALATAAGCSQPAPPPTSPPTTDTVPAPPDTAPTSAVTAPPVARTAPAAAAPTTTAVVAAPPPTSPPDVGGAALGDVKEGVGDVEGTPQTARASWYGSESGSRTADGTPFDGSQMVFAHRTMAFGTLVRFCHGAACVVARCADRGPAAWTGKTFDLSRAVFAAIAPLGSGVITVEWSVV